MLVLTPFLSIFKRFLFPILAVVGLCILCIISLYTGVAEQSVNSNLFAISRLPRTIAVLLAGAGLAVGGLVMQMIAHNRFVEPNTTGTAEGASIGLLVSQFYFASSPLIVRMGFATMCAMVTMLLFIHIAKRLPNSTTNPMLLPLVGMIYAGVLNAGMNFIAYQADLMQWLGVWLNGDFSAVLKGRYEWLWGCAVVIALLYVLADRLTIIGMGEARSHALGLRYHDYVRLGIVLISLMTAFIVATIGTIAFLGLIVPNLVRRITGDNLRHALPWVAWTGASLLLGCDLLARTVNAPYEVPVSLIFGILGTVIFLGLLIGRER